MRQQRKKMNIREFEPLTIIGRGAFGEVRVCRQKNTGNIFAVKKMRKEDMLNKNQLIHVRTEKEILTNDNPWIVKLKYSFQDEYYLYLVMDFVQGGDLMNLLIKKEIFTEDEAKFYISEMILAVESVHKLNCIHRDLKPDNFLIDSNGHIKLSDFGLSKMSDTIFYPISCKNDNKKYLNNDIITNINFKNINFNKNNNNIKNNINNFNNQDLENLSTTNNKNNQKKRLIAYSTVGTPDYIAPEVFKGEGYGMEIDWWSIGVMFFEMIIGYPPFFSENQNDTCKKILKWKENFSIPDDAGISNEAKNLILSLVTTPEKRLKIDEIKKHPFFKNLNWENIRNVKAPFIPKLENEFDTKYFDTFPEQEPFYPPLKNKKRKDLNYPGYTFNRDNENLKDGFAQALEVLDIVQKNIENQKKKEIIIDDSNFENNKKNNISDSFNSKEMDEHYYDKKNDFSTIEINKNNNSNIVNQVNNETKKEIINQKMKFLKIDNYSNNLIKNYNYKYGNYRCNTNHVKKPKNFNNKIINNNSNNLIKPNRSGNTLDSKINHNNRIITNITNITNTIEDINAKSHINLNKSSNLIQIKINRQNNCLNYGTKKHIINKINQTIQTLRPLPLSNNIYVDKTKMNTITNVNKIGILKKKIPVKTSPCCSIKKKTTLNKLKMNLDGNFMNSKNNNFGNIVIKPLKSSEKLRIGKPQKYNLIMDINRVKK